MSASILDASAAQIAACVREGRWRAGAVLEAVLERIARTEPQLGAWLHIDRAGARAQAERIERKRAAGEPLGPLAGVPVAIKDNIACAGMPCTAAARILEGWRPPYDASVVARLREADAVVLGKTNLDAFAMGSSTEHSAFGPTRNPWDRSRVPGGSSGGSAAAVAARHVPLALGSDTGGSIRQPAALCGVVGFKPTYGAVSRYGLIAFASSLDQIGPIARDVTDAALLFEVIAGPDRRDATSLSHHGQSGDDAAAAAPLVAPERLDGVRVGVVREFEEIEEVEPEVRARVREAIERLAALGAEIREVSLPHVRYAIPTYYILAPAECSSNLARYDGVHYGRRAALGPGADVVELYRRSRGEGFGAEVKRRIVLGTYVLSKGYAEAYYGRALRARRLIWQDYRKAFEQVDLIAGPTSPVVAFGLGTRLRDPLAMYAADLFTVSANLAGLPAVSVPCGLDAQQRLPVGVQLSAPWGGDRRLLAIARAYERARGPWSPAVLDEVDA